MCKFSPDFLEICKYPPVKKEPQRRILWPEFLCSPRFQLAIVSTEFISRDISGTSLFTSAASCHRRAVQRLMLIWYFPPSEIHIRPYHIAPRHRLLHERYVTSEGVVLAEASNLVNEEGVGSAQPFSGKDSALEFCCLATEVFRNLRQSDLLPRVCFLPAANMPPTSVGYNQLRRYTHLHKYIHTNIDIYIGIHEDK